MKSEMDLIYSFVTLIFKFDPDIIYGFDVEKSSLFYLAVRYLIETQYINNDCSFIIELLITALI